MARIVVVQEDLAGVLIIYGLCSDLRHSPTAELTFVVVHLEFVLDGCANFCLIIFYAFQQWRQKVEPAAASFFSQLGRRIYVSPKSYLDFLGTFLNMLRERRRALSTRLARRVMMMVVYAMQF